MSSTPLVSVLIRTKDRKALLLEAVQSVLAQSHSPLEILIVNDGGADHAAALPVLEADSGRTLRWLDNRGSGRSAAANTALDAATGSYCVFLDDDDWFDPLHIASLVETCEARPEHLVAYSATRTVMAESGTTDTEAFTSSFDATRLLTENYIPIHAALFSRKLITLGCRFDTAFDRYEDWDFWLQALQHSTFIHVPVCTANYRIAQGSGFGVQSEQDQQHRLALYRKWLPRWNDAQLIAVLDRSRAWRMLAGTQAELADKTNYVALLREQEAVMIRELAERAGVIQKQGGQLAIAHQDKLDTENTLRLTASQLDTERERVAEHAGVIQKLSGQLAIAEQHRLDTENTLRIAEQHRLDTENTLRIAEQDRLDTENTLLMTASQLDTERERVAALNVDLDLIYNSRSWKLTKPLRLFTKVRYFLRTEGLGSVMRRARFKLFRRAPQLPSAHASPPVSAGYHALRFVVHAKPLISIVIPVYNKHQYTFNCLKAVLANSVEQHYEVIVVDDCSSDETAAMLAGIEGITVIRNETNRGYIHSCNTGARAARGEYLLLFNNDTEPQPQWLSALVNTFRDFPDAGMVGAKLLFADGTLQEAGGIVWRDGSAWNYGRNDDPNKPEYSWCRQVDYCSGACLLRRHRPGIQGARSRQKSVLPAARAGDSFRRRQQRHR
jgi:glycosyltransferase involved in cell wall biosynthesis